MASNNTRRAIDTHSVRQTPRSRAFFLELLLSMLIFALCSVVALQVFVEGKMVSDQSAALTHLTMEAKDMAERYKAWGEELETFAAVDEKGALGMLLEEGVLVFSYDADLNMTQDEGARYQLVLAAVEGNSDLVNTIEITGVDDETMLFCFEVANVQSREGR